MEHALLALTDSMPYTYKIVPLTENDSPELSIMIDNLELLEVLKSNLESKLICDTTSLYKAINDFL